MMLKLHVFGLGTAKSGTHSLAAMFGFPLRSMHEANAEALIELLLRKQEGTIDEDELRSFLLNRDRKRRINIDSSPINTYFIGHLTSLFPDAKYVLTVRDCCDWLDSIINDTLRRETSTVWHSFRDFRFGSPTAHPKEERPLADRGLYTLRGYLNYWSRHNRLAMERIDENKLLVVATNHIFDQENIAKFCGAPMISLRKGRSHAFANPHKFGSLNELDRSYLKDVIEECCGETYKRLFPGRAISDQLDKILAE